jgi:hypothetical protein
MTPIESLVGATEREIQEQHWPSKDRAQDFAWSRYVPIRGSIRLATGRIIGRDEVAQRWNELVSLLRKQP